MASSLSDFSQEKGNFKGKCVYVLMLIKQLNRTSWTKLQQEFKDLSVEDSYDFYQKLVRELQSLKLNGRSTLDEAGPSTSKKKKEKKKKSPIKISSLVPDEAGDKKEAQKSGPAKKHKEEEKPATKKIAKKKAAAKKTTKKKTTKKKTAKKTAKKSAPKKKTAKKKTTKKKTAKKKKKK